MKVFLCWSGNLSRQIARMFHGDLRLFFPKLKIFMSDADITAGDRWFAKLLNELKDTHFGIVFLTPENIKNQWINFETGALTKHLDGKACGLLLKNMSSDKVTGPLQNFQNKSFDKSGFIEILLAINKKIRPPLLENNILKKVDNKWPIINKKYKILLNKETIKENEDHKKNSYLIIWNEFTDAAKNIYFILGTETRGIDWVQQQTTINQSHSMSLIWSLLDKISFSRKNLLTSQTKSETLREIGNEIIIGGPNNNGWTRTLIKQIKSQFNLDIFIGQDLDKNGNVISFGNIMSIKSLDGKRIYFGPQKTRPEYEGDGDPRIVIKDLGIIIMQKQLYTKTIAIAGCHSLGTLAAAKAITNDTFIREKIEPNLTKGINSRSDNFKIFIVETYKETAKMPLLVYPQLSR